MEMLGTSDELQLPLENVKKRAGEDLAGQAVGSTSMSGCWTVGALVLS